MQRQKGGQDSDGGRGKLSVAATWRREGGEREELRGVHTEGNAAKMEGAIA